MAERGYRLTCVELGEDMATVARRELASFDHVQVITSSFEDWPLPSEPFDLVMAATAFHWIAREHAVPKAAAALRPGGALAVFAHEHVAGGTAEFFSLMQRCYEQYMPGTPPGLECSPDVDVTPFVREIAATGLFAPAIVRKYFFEVEYTTSQYLDLLRTYSGHIALDADNQANLFACLQDLIDNRFGGRIRKHYLTNLVLARRDVEKSAAAPI
jgi:SAM-dependent methyltransferase